MGDGLAGTIQTRIRSDGESGSFPICRGGRIPREQGLGMLQAEGIPDSGRVYRRRRMLPSPCERTRALSVFPNSCARFSKGQGCPLARGLRRWGNPCGA